MARPCSSVRRCAAAGAPATASAMASHAPAGTRHPFLIVVIRFTPLSPRPLGIPPACAILEPSCGTGTCRTRIGSVRLEINVVLVKLLTNQPLPWPFGHPDPDHGFVGALRILLRDNGAIEEDHRRRA